VAYIKESGGTKKGFKSLGANIRIEDKDHSILARQLTSSTFLGEYAREVFSGVLISQY
jgi:hypothetical protein